MKKLLLYFCLLFLSIDGFSQNWQCVQAGVQRYFNGNSLKGMRIDSAVTVGSDVVLYPFRSPRGPYSTSFWPPIYLDTNGGSWLGKQITIKQDGTNTFDTYWGDTVFINTLAGMGSSWIFYNDTSARYYLATVTSLDTMSVLNVLDSVKTITITAYNPQGLNPTDMAHNKTIRFSKSNGLVRTFSLYMFPFHPPFLQSYTTNQDFLLDSVDVSSGNINSFDIDYYRPTATDIFDYNVGDVFEYKGNMALVPYWRLDSIKAKNIVSPTQVVYTISVTKLDYHPGGPNPYWSYSYYTTTFTPQAPLIPVNLMPEETGTRALIHYYPDDSSRCLKSHLYRTSPFIGGNALLILCGERSIYKAGIGRVDYRYCSEAWPGAPGNQEEEMVFSLKNSIPCGNLYPIINGIDDKLKERDEIDVYPSPASYILNVIHAGRYSYRLSDLVGKVVASGTANGKAEVSVHHLLSGFYTLYILDEAGNKRAVRKVLVQH